MNILCLAAKGTVDSAHILYFLGHVSEKLAGAIQRKLTAFSALDTIPSVRSLKILNPKIWGYKGTIYKLRIDCGAESARILLMLDAQNDLVVLHAFLKKTRKTPKKEAETAIRHFDAVCANAELMPLFPSALENRR
ncbi:type II toxin-antitoxin system RelE/ParE family toxin [Edwardsiella piscicida]|nr:type II toxin-antitoxin system RelE/ParE family toxin [Edwardsiella piscicida]QBB12480.1 hypothetical protein EVK84_08005 [Edwardsiella piscicida]UCQ14613.1 type II toxin-antitoxin system RelE/ParE family toxin [Edwardsiella piscicida]UCQ37801.1 type II toxin-antitoxin system RelE/ParE family toxin [Edwardsiella piscicida]